MCSAGQKSGAYRQWRHNYNAIYAIFCANMSERSSYELELLLSCDIFLHVSESFQMSFRNWGEETAGFFSSDVFRQIAVPRQSTQVFENFKPEQASNIKINTTHFLSRVDDILKRYCGGCHQIARRSNNECFLILLQQTEVSGGKFPLIKTNFFEGQKLLDAY